jgi:hypothetical protein
MPMQAAKGQFKKCNSVCRYHYGATGIPRDGGMFHVIVVSVQLSTSAFAFGQ